MTIRFRIIIYYSSLLIAIIGLFGAAVFGIMNWTMMNETEADLQKVIDDFIGKQGEKTIAYMDITVDGQSQLILAIPQLNEFRAPGMYLQAWQVKNHDVKQLISSNITYEYPLDPKPLGSSEKQYSTVSIEGTHLRVLTQPIAVDGKVAGSIQAATTLTTIEAATDRLLKIMLGGGVIALLISLMLGDWIARRILIPVQAIAKTAQAITAADDLSKRIAYDGPQDELGRMVTAFNETLNRLESLFVAQRRFVGDVSHELRTPLTTIKGNLDLVRMYGNDPRSIQAIDSEVQRMTRMVGDLLLLAQADSGQLPMKFTQLPLDQMILEVYNEAVLINQGKHHLKLGELDTVMLEGDADRLKQLFLNLVTNAFKYTADGGHVEVSLTRNQTEARVSVSDTGVGIPEDDLKYIFNRFYRVDKARSRAAGGTGLGLAIANWIAEAHHGAIKVKSKFGEGSTFTVILPIDQPHPEELVIEQTTLPILSR